MTLRRSTIELTTYGIGVYFVLALVVGCGQAIATPDDVYFPKPSQGHMPGDFGEGRVFSVKNASYGPEER